MLNQTDVLTGIETFEVTNASHFSADTFKLTADINKLPPGLGIDYWGASAGDEIEIFAGFKDTTGHGQSKSLIYGQIDEVDVDIVGRIMTFTGRDLSARFLDTQTDIEAFQDQTASNIAIKLATALKLKTSVTPTNTPVGSYYEQCNLRLTREQTYWDVLMFLAQEENYDVWVAGQTLFFQPPVPLTQDPYVLLWSDQGQGNRVANFESLHMQRSQTLAKDIIVKIESWNQVEETRVTAEAKRNQPNKSQRGGGKAQIYTFRPPNLNQQQAEKYAQSMLATVTKNERIISGKTPGDSLLSNRSLVKLVGTGTSWDQSYFVDSVTRRMSFSEGYCMEFRAKNHTTQSTV